MSDSRIKDNKKISLPILGFCVVSKSIFYKPNLTRAALSPTSDVAATTGFARLLIGLVDARWTSYESRRHSLDLR